MTTTQQARTYRASRAPLYWLCPAAAYADDDAVLIEPVDDAGTMGTAVHEACREIVADGEFTTDRIVATYGLNQAQRQELIILAQVGIRFWREYGDAFRRDDGVVRALDWKTTRLEGVNYRPQMMEYGFLTLEDAALDAGLFAEHELRFGNFSGHPDVLWCPENPNSYQYTIVYLRDKTLETSERISQEQLYASHAEYVKAIEGWDGRIYCPGGHCTYCPRSACCPALEERLALTVRSLRPAEETTVAEKIAVLTDEQCVLTYERIRLAEKMLAEAVRLIKIRAENSNGTLQGDGKALVLKKEEWEVIGNARAAWPVLKTQLTDAEIAGCVEVSKKGVLDRIAAKAARGAKKRAKNMFMDRLRDAGALSMDGRMMPRIVQALPGATETGIETQESEE